MDNSARESWVTSGWYVYVVERVGYNNTLQYKSECLLPHSHTSERDRKSDSDQRLCLQIVVMPIHSNYDNLFETFHKPRSCRRPI